MGTKIAHIVNPVYFAKTSSQYFAQQVAFHTMNISRDLAGSELDIEFISVQFPEDHPIIPNFFQLTPDLRRSILDIGNFNKPRKLPLIKDIFDLALEATDAEFIIYTNVDICLMPFFYKVVNKFIEEGYDAVTVNRRTISSKYREIDSLPLMYAEIGEAHRGWDCFVFKRDYYSKFLLGDIALGIPLVGLGMIANLIAFGENFHQVTQAHLTFHIGNDRAWHDRVNSDFNQHNRREVLNILRELNKKIGGFDPKSPPGVYLRYHQNIIISYFYDRLFSHLYIPVKYTRFFRRTNL